MNIVTSTSIRMRREKNTYRGAVASTIAASRPVARPPIAPPITSVARIVTSAAPAITIRSAATDSPSRRYAPATSQ